MSTVLASRLNSHEYLRVPVACGNQRGAEERDMKKSQVSLLNFFKKRRPVNGHSDSEEEHQESQGPKRTHTSQEDEDEEMNEEQADQEGLDVELVDNEMERSGLQVDIAYYGAEALKRQFSDEKLYHVLNLPLPSPSTVFPYDSGETDEWQDCQEKLQTRMAVPKR